MATRRRPPHPKRLQAPPQPLSAREAARSARPTLTKAVAEAFRLILEAAARETVADIIPDTLEADDG